MTGRSRSTTGLAGLFAVMGVLHFVKPKPFERIVPKALPAKKELVYASGVAELACAAGLLHPRTRRVAGLASAALLTGVFPANVQLALDLNRKGSPRAKAVAFARLPLQLPLIRAALKAARETT
ncbi:membrane protein-like protein [Kribbella flavida DSM 17836]|uniref:Membrane protein-like protein n=1 Tax=Kribbella flavida (strain DSM 17836 / JCM 10339 / NBRC 14399) TaxID=479435 RepID=D2Q1V3_KRIFD|nr:DoxX family protein [Kribbella flavida]ADB32092.1 membrane protein-like protein [Kribbella flavida DSM 17836]